MTVEEHVHFGQPGDFMTVRHLKIRGTNFEIGQALGSIAIERYDRTPAHFEATPAYVRARRQYLQKVFPLQWERMRGVADAFDLDPEDDRHDLAGAGALYIDFPPGFGCSVVYFPPRSTSTGGGCMSRNYDFYIDSMPAVFGIPPPTDAKPAPAVMSEPYIMEWHPSDGGHASVAIHAFDTLAGTLDGINSAGLVVSILADNESMTTLGPNWEPHPGPEQVVGLHELATMRLLLDTCATVDEAKDSLLGVKQYYRFMPLTYIVADRAGQSFIYENSTGRNIQHMIDGTGEPQIASNFLLSKHPTPESRPDGPWSPDNDAFWRYRTMAEQIASHQGPFTVPDMKAITSCVNTNTVIGALRADPAQKDVAEGIVTRTVWHSLYDQQAGTMQASFYLGDKQREDGTWSERHSDYLTVALD